MSRLPEQCNAEWVDVTFVHLNILRWINVELYVTHAEANKRIDQTSRQKKASFPFISIDSAFKRTDKQDKCDSATS